MRHTRRGSGRQADELRLAEFFLPVVGPAQLSAHDAVGRGVSAEEELRERELHVRYEVVTDSTGHRYVIDRGA